MKFSTVAIRRLQCAVKRRWTTAGDKPAPELDYIDDFVLCFQYREDALRVQDALRKRLGKFGLTLEPTKTKLVEFGRFAQRHAGKRGRKRPETIYFLGFTLYCTTNRKGGIPTAISMTAVKTCKRLFTATTWV